MSLLHEWELCKYKKKNMYGKFCILILQGFSLGTFLWTFKFSICFLSLICSDNNLWKKLLFGVYSNNKKDYLKSTLVIWSASWSAVPHANIVFIYCIWSVLQTLEITLPQPYKVFTLPSCKTNNSNSFFNNVFLH